MGNDILSTLAHSRLGSIVKSTPGVATVAEKAYDKLREHHADQYFTENNGIIEFKLPVIDSVYFKECNLDYNEIKFLNYILNNVNNGDTIYDIGANIGSHTIPYSQLFDVIAFEPVQTNREILKTNLSIHKESGGKFGSIDIRELALTRQEWNWAVCHSKYIEKPRR